MELLLGNRFPLKTKGKVLSLLRKISDIVWKGDMVLKENEKTSLRRTERESYAALESCRQKDD